MKANEFDARFDDGQDIAAALDTARARHLVPQPDRCLIAGAFTEPVGRKMTPGGH